MSAPFVPAEPKRLFRDPARAVFGGVCVGLAEYLDVDPTVVRVVAALLAVVTFFTAILAYLVMWALVPPRPATLAPPPPPVHQS